MCKIHGTHKENILMNNYFTLISIISWILPKIYLIFGSFMIIYEGLEQKYAFNVQNLKRLGLHGTYSSALSIENKRVEHARIILQNISAPQKLQ